MQESDHFVHSNFNLWVTNTQLYFKPCYYHIEAILKMALLKNVKPVHTFSRTVNFIKNHKPEWAKLLKQPTRIMKKEIKIKWGNKQQKA